MGTKEDFFTGNIISVGNGIQTYAEITFKNNDGEDEKKLIEMGNITDIVTQSQRKIGRIDKNGNAQAQGFQRGTRLGQGKMVISNFDVNAISYIEKVIDNMGNSIKNPFESVDLDGDSIGAGFENSGEITFKEDIKPNVSSVSLMSLPPINIVLIAKADYVNQMGVSDISDSSKQSVLDGYKLDSKIKYNQVVIKKIKGLSFTGNSDGIDAMQGLKDTVAEFLILGGEEPWKFLNNNA